MFPINNISVKNNKLYIMPREIEKKDKRWIYRFDLNFCKPMAPL